MSFTIDLPDANDIDPTTGLPSPVADVVAPVGPPADAWPLAQAVPGAPPSPGRSLPPPAPPRKVRSGLRAGVAGGVVGALVAGGVSFATVKLTEKDTTTVKPAVVAGAPAPASSTAANTGTTGAGVTSVTGGIDVRAVLALVAPSVVSIEIGQQTGSTVTPVAAGSGVVISADGTILTNAHVVALTDANGRALSNPVVSVKTADGKLRTAKILGTSPGNDVALVKVDDTSGLAPIALGDSTTLQVGDPVLAIGNALDLGDSPTVTSGIISAKDRTLQVDANVTLYGLLQTDAAINHGNSGGALVNAKGQLVGVPSAGLPNTNNVGFAIAIEKITPLLDQLKQGGTVTTAVAVLGVTATEDVKGVTVSGVSQGSGAEKAGIQVGDVITSIDGKAINGQDALGTAIKAHKPGDTIRVGLLRNGQAITVTATLGALQQ